MGLSQTLASLDTTGTYRVNLFYSYTPANANTGITCTLRVLWNNVEVYNTVARRADASTRWQAASTTVTASSPAQELAILFACTIAGRPNDLVASLLLDDVTVTPEL